MGKRIELEADGSYQAIDPKTMQMSEQTIDGSVSTGNCVYYDADSSTWKVAGINTATPQGIYIGTNTVVLVGVASGLSGLLAGEVYWLDSSGGLVSGSGSSASKAKIGFALSATELLVNIAVEGSSFSLPVQYVNFFGDGLDGIVDFDGSATVDGITKGGSSYGTGLPTSDVYEIIVQNKSGSYNGDMVVKQYDALTIGSGMYLTTDQPCKGLTIFVKGDCVINGTIGMTARGAYIDPVTAGVNAAGLRFPYSTSSGSTDLSTMSNGLAGCGTAAEVVDNYFLNTGTGDIFTIQRTGADGGAANNLTSGIAGSNGDVGQSGGGGTGGGAVYTAGAGAAGTCFSGGSASGGTSGTSGTSNATLYGGAGSAGVGEPGFSTGGGAGNPGGNGYDGGPAGDNGTGGLIVLIVGGSLTIASSTGFVTANGKSGGDGFSRDGGGSGGGNIVIIYKNTYTNNGIVSADGGSGAAADGGAGSIQIAQVL